MSRSIAVRHAGGHYDVVIAPGILRELGNRVAGLLPGRRVVRITDEAVAARLAGWGAGDVGELRLTVPPGEGAKSRPRWAALTDAMLEAGLGRDSVVVAIGGGVVGDLAGFVAATYLRGVPTVLAPTTLLAMVDAAVGGKVGVDTPLGKNLVGAFHPPSLVLADPLVLQALPDRELRGGLAEAIKHGLVADAGYFAWLEEAMPDILARDPDTLTHLVARSVEIKAAIVERDEREAGQRAVLNAGHTVAHALERTTDYALPHGEAVAIGLVVEARLAVARAGLHPDAVGRLTRLLAAAGLPTRPGPECRPDRVVEAARLDKKNRAGEIRCALASAIGEPHRTGGSWTTVTPPDLLLRAIREST